MPDNPKREALLQKLESPDVTVDEVRAGAEAFRDLLLRLSQSQFGLTRASTDAEMNEENVQGVTAHYQSVGLSARAVQVIIGSLETQATELTRQLRAQAVAAKGIREAVLAADKAERVARVQAEEAAALEELRKRRAEAEAARASGAGGSVGATAPN